MPYTTTTVLVPVAGASMTVGATHTLASTTTTATKAAVTSGPALFKGGSGRAVSGVWVSLLRAAMMWVIGIVIRV